MTSPARNAGIASYAALAATLGDLMMLYVANARREDLGLAPPGAGWLWAGGVLGVVAIPAYAFGYRAAADLIRATSVRAARTVEIAGLSAALVGAAIHGLTAVHIARALESGSAASDPIASIAESGPLLPALWILAAIAALVASIAFGYRVVRGAGSVPRTTALVTPAVLTVAIATVGVLSNWLAAFVTPAAPNLAHVAFFVVLARTHTESGEART